MTEAVKQSIAIIGQGYVGLPLAVAFAEHFDVLGYDISARRVEELSAGHDRTGEMNADQLQSPRLKFTSDVEQLKTATVYIVTVPTPVSDLKAPDLTALKSASATVGKVLCKGDLVIYESTVYPGATEEDCLPILEQTSGLRLNRDFDLGYSPERINPGDRERTVADIVKVTSGSSPKAAERVDQLYNLIVRAGTHKAESIKVAEAAKVIENVQRDLNIALMNELALIFDKIGIDTLDVLKAAGTKWNFLPFRPGLVGGHCISVDPYYLTHKAQATDYHPDVILAGRKINDGMGGFVADKVAKLIIKAGHTLYGAKVLVLGATFKENCKDMRNTRVVDIVHQLQSWGLEVEVWEPVGDLDEVQEVCGDVAVHREMPKTQYQGLILAVAHEEFAQMAYASVDKMRATNGIIYDVKSLWPRDWVTARL